MKIQISDSQLEKMTKKVFPNQNVKDKLQLFESARTEEQALSILNAKNIENPEEVLNRFKEMDKLKNQNLLPVMAYFYTGNNQEIMGVFRDMVELVEKGHLKIPIVKKDGVVAGENLYTDDLSFSEFIHHLHERKISRTEKTDVRTGLTKDKPIFDKNGILIYDGSDKGRCVDYTLGGVTGKKYSFCIGQKMHNYYHRYRGGDTSTFYFVVDKNRNFETDPLHIVVVDHTARGFRLTDKNNTTGNIAEYGSDVKGYFNYLESKGVNTKEVFKHRPKSDEEKKEEEIIGSPNSSLEFFLKLSIELKEKYIDREHRLTDAQFDVLWQHRRDNNYEKLLNIYFGTGHSLGEYQFNKMVNEG